MSFHVQATKKGGVALSLQKTKWGKVVTRVERVGGDRDACAVADCLAVAWASGVDVDWADALAAGKASADAAAAHSKRVAERAKDAAHQRVSRAAQEFARYRAAVEARLDASADGLRSILDRARAKLDAN